MHTDNTTPLSAVPMDDEITLKELVVKIKSYAWEVIRLWWVVLIFLILSVSYFYHSYTKDRAKYSADLTFVVNTDGGMSMGLGAILGGAMGGGAGNAKLDKIIEFSRSRRITASALFKMVEANNKIDLLANHLIIDQQLHKKWEKDTTGLKGFLFNPTRQSVDSFSRMENKVLIVLHNILVGKKPIFEPSYDKKSEIMHLKIATFSEDLSIILLRVLYSELSKYYIYQSTAKEEKTYSSLKKQVDSVKGLLDRKEMAAAVAQDAARGTFLEEDKQKIERMKKDGMLYNVVYGEALKSMTMAGLAKENSQPFIRDLDMPIGPIKPEKLSLLKSLAMGLGLGGFLGALIVIIRKIFVDALA